MTRGKIVFVEDEILCSVEFNGSMGLDWFGESIMKSLAGICSRRQFEEFIKSFNTKNFNYECTPYEPIYDDYEDKLFDMSEKYIDKCSSDWLYIKNGRSESVTIIDRHLKKISVSAGGIVALYFGDYDDECKTYSVGTTASELSDKVIKICESQGWDVDVFDDYVQLQQYSPAGEDFFFEVSKERFVEDIKEYARDFDPDEHAEMWVGSRGTHGVPSSIRQLINDADAIDEMLQNLANALPDLD